MPKYSLNFFIKYDVLDTPTSDDIWDIWSSFSIMSSIELFNLVCRIIFFSDVFSFASRFLVADSDKWKNLAISWTLHFLFKLVSINALTLSLKWHIDEAIIEWIMWSLFLKFDIKSKELIKVIISSLVMDSLLKKKTSSFVDAIVSILSFDIVV